MSSVPRSIRRATRTGRAPLTSLGIPFGLAGLAGTWTMAARAGLVTNVIAELLWTVAALAWVVVVVNYLARSRNRGGSIAADLRDPVQGAFASLAPTAAMLVCTHYAAYLPRSGRIATSVFMVLALVFGAWFLAQLVQHQRSIDAVHAGYLLPTVAAAFIVAQGAGTFAWGTLAVAAIAVGLLTWLIIGTVVLARMAFRPAPPAALLPTFAIFSAPPAVAGNAWFAHNGGQPDLLETMLLGTFVVLILVQVMMLGTYARLPFHLGFWAFTFTAASSGTYAVHWLALWHSAGYELWAWLAVVIVTVLIGGIAVRSVEVLLRAHAASRATTPRRPRR
ncbi:C4-dicarboxylate transporter [Pengzhenrongella frigida]|uniref:C4-dicarboxylate transporter n=1 Tax=Pengzhenrongella frigida TaxID=1259133 RepID=A0A4Q5MW13_9MICO|nr:C4-dicarboxylate transporter [Cellulomonas sp. HLT2-17]RYV49786.1 C4-dicarboxylate transporter [Cellulomonas sp. HLT2-17]